MPNLEICPDCRNATILCDCHKQKEWKFSVPTARFLPWLMKVGAVGVTFFVVAGVLGTLTKPARRAPPIEHEAVSEPALPRKMARATLKPVVQDRGTVGWSQTSTLPAWTAWHAAAVRGPVLPASSGGVSEEEFEFFFHQGPWPLPVDDETGYPQQRSLVFHSGPKLLPTTHHRWGHPGFRTALAPGSALLLRAGRKTDRTSAGVAVFRTRNGGLGVYMTGATAWRRLETGERGQLVWTLRPDLLAWISVEPVAAHDIYYRFEIQRGDGPSR